MVNEILSISLVTKILKKLDLYAYSVHELLYLRNTDGFNKIRKNFIKYMEILEKVRNIVKINLIVS